jgi:hypothetical protein
MDPLDRAIRRSDKVLRCYLACIALDPRFRVRPVSYVLWLVILPLLLFGAFCGITHKEARFGLGSLDLPAVPGSRDVIAGLSFLGDTMVWPFLLLIPLLLVLLRAAIGKAVALRRESATLVRGEILTSPACAEEFGALAGQFEATLCYRSLTWRWLRHAALVVGLLVFVYNTVACIRGDAWPDWPVLYDRIWSLLKPYGSHQVVIKPDTVVVTLKDSASFITPCSDPAKDFCLPPALSKLAIDRDRHRLSWSGPLSLDERRAMAELWPGAEWQQVVQSLSQQKQEGFVSDKLRTVEKWDTDVRGAPLSWTAARIWVLLIGYALLPLAVLRVSNVLVAVWRFANVLARSDMLKANPFSSESRKSLDLIVQPLFAASYCLVVVSIMVALAFFKVGAKPEWYDLALLVLIPLFAFAALAPLLSISATFERDVKARYLAAHATVIGIMHQDFHNDTAAMDPVTRGSRTDALMKYSDYLARGEATAVFPISLATITRLLAPMAPLVLTLIEKAFGAFF